MSQGGCRGFRHPGTTQGLGKTLCRQEATSSGQRLALTTGGDCMDFSASWTSKLPGRAPGLVPACCPPPSGRQHSTRSVIVMVSQGIPVKLIKLYSLSMYSVLYVYFTSVERFLIKKN